MAFDPFPDGRALAAERQRLGSRAQQGKVGFAFAQAEGAHGYMADLTLAEGAFRRAVAIGTGDPEAASPTQLLKARSSLVLVLMRLGQPVLAAMEQRLGIYHRFILALRSTRFESFAALGRYEDAANEARHVWQGASAQAGPESHQALVGQTDYASALCQTGERRKGMDLASDALRSAHQTFGEDYPLTHVIRYYAAECLLANRDHARAGELLAGLDRQKVAELTGQPDFGGIVDLAMGEIAMGRGDTKTAAASLQTAQASLAKSQDQKFQRRLATLKGRLQ